MQGKALSIGKRAVHVVVPRAPSCGRCLCVRHGFTAHVLPRAGPRCVFARYDLDVSALAIDRTAQLGKGNYGVVYKGTLSGG